MKKRDKNQKMGREIAANLRFGFTVSFLAAPKYFLLKCLLSMAGIVLPFGGIWIWKEVLNGIAGGTEPGRTGLFLAGLYLVQRVAVRVADKVDEYVDSRFSDELHYHMNRVMMEKISRMDLAYFDSASMGDRISFVRENQETLFRLPPLLFALVSNGVSAVMTLALVGIYRWWLGIAAVLFLFPCMACDKRHRERCLDMEKQTLRDRRRQDYFYHAFLEQEGYFELKFYRLKDYFLDRWREVWWRIYRINRKEERGYGIWNAVLSCLGSSGSLLVMLVSAWDALCGRIGIGDLQYHVSLVTRLREQVSGLVETIGSLLEDNVRISGVREFVEMDALAERTGTRMPSAYPEIAFDHVFFRYPNTEQDVLKDCSFTVRPYEKVGLIGSNGAGKSTVIKLMFRFYDPTEGRILLDGVDIREYDVYAVRRVFGVLFQDYVTYSLPVREVVALSDFQERHNDARLDFACGRSGADEVISGWTDGYDSILGRYYADGGRSLSGGQWQIVGLARAYFRECEFMILDEPSAALDPVAEDRLFRQMYRLGREKSTVTISHRLSNTILADKILVIQDGGISEEGTHEELMALNGMYAHMFRLQAKRYL